MPGSSSRAYDIVDQLPRFEFTVDGYTTRQSVAALEDRTGLRMSFEMPEVDQPVYFVTRPDAGVTFESSAGTWDEGVLELSPEQARSFSITLVEVPGHAPRGAWSMNDDPWTAFMDVRTRPGVNGRSLHYQEHETPTGVTGSQLDAAGSFVGWVQLQETEGRQFIIGQRDADSGQRFALVYDDGFAFEYIDPQGEQQSIELNGIDDPQDWNHLAWTREGRRMTVYVNGEPVETIQTGPLLPEAEFTIGASRGQNHVNAHLDTFKLWSRRLNERELERAMHFE